MKKKKQIRENFRNDVFTRDKYICQGCNTKFDETYLDAHHITDRNEIINGGYVKENGITLCTECHIKAEHYHISEGEEWIEDFHPNDLYEIINSNLELAIKKSELLNNN